MDKEDAAEHLEEHNTHQDNEFGSTGMFNRFLSIFARQNDVLERAFLDVIKTDSEFAAVLSAFLCRIKGSSGSLFVIAKMNKAGDCFVLARSIFETIVNTCFLCARGIDMVKRAQRHAMQKSYRNLERSLIINGRKIAVFWPGRELLKECDELKAALKEFTDKRGREITLWTPETTKEKITQIDAKYGKACSSGLQSGLFGIYRDASDITHGTFFGALILLGATQPKKLPAGTDEIFAEQRKQICMILVLLSLAINSLIHILAQEFSLGNLKEESDEIEQLYHKEPYFQGDRDPRKRKRSPKAQGGYHWTSGDSSSNSD